ncbi:hypothetical protein AgCh_016483 [Apium graveolens]
MFKIVILKVLDCRCHENQISHGARVRGSSEHSLTSPALTRVKHPLQPGTQPQLRLYSGEGSKTASKEQPRHQELSFGARRRGSPSLGLGAPGFTFINKLFKESIYSNL